MRIDPFPGVLTKLPVPAGRNNARISYRYFLTDEQREWLIKWFPEEGNSRLMEVSGMKSCTLHRFARELGLRKSTSGMKIIRKRHAAHIKRLCEANGYYDSLRGKPVSEACLAGTRRMWQEVREGKRLHPFRRMSKYRQKKIFERMSAAKKELIRKEKLRQSYGLERNTKLHLPIVPYTRSQVFHRSNALKRGYFYYAGKLTDNDRYIIFYDDRTKRSELFERNLRKDHFIIEEWKEE